MPAKRIVHPVAYHPCSDCFCIIKYVKGCVEKNSRVSWPIVKLPLSKERLDRTYNLSLAQTSTCLFETLLPLVSRFKNVFYNLPNTVIGPLYAK